MSEREEQIILNEVEGGERKREKERKENLPGRKPESERGGDRQRRADLSRRPLPLKGAIAAKGRENLAAKFTYSPMYFVEVEILFRETLTAFTIIRPDL